MLVGVEEDEEASAELVGELLEVGGQMAEDRDGDLAVGGAAAVQPAVDDARFGRRVVPDTEIAEWRGVQAGIEVVGGTGLGAEDFADDRHRAPPVCREHRDGYVVVSEPCRNVLDHGLAGVRASATGDGDQLARQRDDGLDGRSQNLGFERPVVSWRRARSATRFRCRGSARLARV